ncbi:unnamed protein product [Allacma fusca]|uniref:CHHC U11-48K-type domain-containing protein n=1 Tax=Allacma fusca TaxID=39272 RepID=A0A8J2KFZ9_9HEXA|nr:unnamed protein product [Allacma fusca]
MQAPFKLGPDEQFVQCPYEKSHLISNLRFLVHLDKCRRNYKKKCEEQGKTPEIVHCRFNDAHRLPQIEMNYHETNCKDQYAIVKHIQNMQHVSREEAKRKLVEPEEPKSCPKVDQTEEDEEDWDNDTRDCRPGYDPSEKLRNEAIMYIPRGLTKSERKKWRLQNREKFAGLEDKQVTEECKYDDELYDEYGRRIVPSSSRNAPSTHREGDYDCKDYKIRKIDY